MSVFEIGYNACGGPLNPIAQTVLLPPLPREVLSGYTPPSRQESQTEHHNLDRPTFVQSTAA